MRLRISLSSAVRDPPVPLVVKGTDVVPRSMYRYSTFTVQFPASAASTPVPIVQPDFVSCVDVPVVGNVGTKIVRSLLMRAKAQPAVTYERTGPAGQPSRARTVPYQGIFCSTKNPPPTGLQTMQAESFWFAPWKSSSPPSTQRSICQLEPA